MRTTHPHTSPTRLTFSSTIKRHNGAILLVKYYKDRLAHGQATLRRLVARQRRCKKPAKREWYSTWIRVWTTDNIHVDARLYEREHRQRDLYEDYRVRSHLYAKMECYWLCKQLYEKLRRELRDVVYIHVLGERSVLVTPPLSYTEHEEPCPADGYQKLVISSPLQVKLVDQDPAGKHVFRRTFIKTAVLYELVEAFYRHTSFSSRTPTSSIPSFSPAPGGSISNQKNSSGKSSYEYPRVRSDLKLSASFITDIITETSRASCQSQDWMFLT